MTEKKKMPKNFSDPAIKAKFMANAGRFKDPEFQRQALMIKKAKEEASFRDPQAYLKRLFNFPKKGGSTVKLACMAVERATRHLSEELIENGDNYSIKEYLSMLENLKKTLAFIDDLNSEAAGKAINRLVVGNMQINNNSSKTGGVVGSVMDVMGEDLDEPKRI